MLKTLGFCVHVKHPHKLIVSYIKLLGFADQHIQEKLAQRAWNYMNDGLRTNIFVRFPRTAIACACLHLATIDLEVPMPDWWPAFDVITADVHQIW